MHGSPTTVRAATKRMLWISLSATRKLPVMFPFIVCVPQIKRTWSSQHMFPFQSIVPWWETCHSGTSMSRRCVHLCSHYICDVSFELFPPLTLQREHELSTHCGSIDCGGIELHAPIEGTICMQWVTISGTCVPSEMTMQYCNSESFPWDYKFPFCFSSTLNYPW